MSSYEIVPDLAVCVVVGSVENTSRFLRSVYDTADHVSLQVFVVAERGLDCESLTTEFSDILFCPQGGSVSSGFNAVIERSSARYISFWDDTVVVLNGCLMRLVGFLDEEGEVGIVGPKMGSETGVIQQVARTFPSCLALFGRGLPGKLAPGWAEYASGETDWFAGSGMVVSRLLLDDIGALSHWRDHWQLDLCRRAKRAGWHVHYLHDAQVTASLALWQKKIAGGAIFFLRRWVGNFFLKIRNF